MRLGKYCVATCEVSGSAGTWDSLRMHFICGTKSWCALGLLRVRPADSALRERGIAMLFPEKCLRTGAADINSRINSGIGRTWSMQRSVTCESKYNEVTFPVTTPAKFCSAEYGSLIARQANSIFIAAVSISTEHDKKYRLQLQLIRII